MKSILKAVFILLCIAMVDQAVAQSATDCIQTGTMEEYGRQARYIENICRQDIIAVWCFDDALNIPNNVRCGGNEYYQYRSHLKPGEVYTNRYSLITDGTIYYAACLGDNIWSDLPEMDSSGRYRCN